jgi:hypothetical protein
MFGAPTTSARRNGLHEPLHSIPVNEREGFGTESRYWLQTVGRGPKPFNTRSIDAVIQDGTMWAMELFVVAPNAPTFTRDLDLWGSVASARNL